MCMQLAIDIQTQAGFGHSNKQEERELEAGLLSCNYSSITQNLNLAHHQLDYMTGLKLISHNSLNKLKNMYNQDSSFTLAEHGFNLMEIYLRGNQCEGNFYMVRNFLNKISKITEKCLCCLIHSGIELTYHKLPSFREFNISSPKN